MKNMKKMIGLIICVVMVIGMLSITAFAKSDTETMTLKVSLLGATADATATLEVEEDYAIADTSFTAMATSMAINLSIRLSDSHDGVEKNEYYTTFSENAGNIVKSVTSDTNEEFLYAVADHTVRTAWDGYTVTLTADAG